MRGDAKLLARRVCDRARDDTDQLVPSTNSDGVVSYVLAKPGGRTGAYEVEVVGLCKAHTPPWLSSLQVGGRVGGVAHHTDRCRAV